MLCLDILYLIQSIIALLTLTLYYVNTSSLHTPHSFTTTTTRADLTLGLGTSSDTRVGGSFSSDTARTGGIERFPNNNIVLKKINREFK